MLKIKEATATIPAQDIKRAREFYEQKLGLKPEDEQPDGSVVYRTGNTGFLLFPSMGKASGDHTQLGLDVDDVISAVNELKSAGVKLEEYDYPDFKTKDGIADMMDGSKGAWFKDTEGNLIALAQRVPAGTRAR
jgi:predicted enzyme related to lactoylglutathione lyase